MYRAKKICMEGGKVYYPGEVWVGNGEPSEKNFSFCGETIKCVEVPVDDGLGDKDYFELREIGKTYGITRKLKKPVLIRSIREARKLGE